MADTAAVQFLLDNLTQLISHHYNLISGVKSEVEQLKSDLSYFISFLRYASRKKPEDERVVEYVKQIRDAVYDAEDVVDAYVTKKESSKNSGNWLKRFFGDTIRLDRIAREVAEVRETLKGVYGDKHGLDEELRRLGDHGSHDNSEDRRERRANVVGLEDEAKKIIGYLTEETKEGLQVVSITGMPGLGKTTLAGKIFDDPSIQYEFPTRIWVYVSKFTARDVFLSILGKLTSEEVRVMDDDDLARKVSGHLEGTKFLIVMDDIWDRADWDRVSVALPKSNPVGKVLITSRHEHVARYACRRDPHQLRFLNKDESWELLQYEVFGRSGNCPSELEDWGKIIAQKCNGLPLSIVVIGGIIASQSLMMADTPTRGNAWQNFSERVNEHLQGEPAQTMERIISLSYDRLPYHLRPCFLYFGMFPENSSIPVWKLIRMWIAEGFILERGSFSLEETAEDYLHDLISRNLVRDDERSLDGRVKTCRIHDSLRDFCKLRAGPNNENFHQEIRKSLDGNLVPPIRDDTKYRRLSIHTSILDFVSSRPSGKRVRSFVCFCEGDVELPTSQYSAIPAGFKLLRVIDMKPLIFERRLPLDMFQLLHLRYIHLSFKLEILPSPFANLWNMQTLVVSTSQRTLQIKADIWKMRNLRHLKTNAIASLPEPGSSSSVANEVGRIQTLGKISPQNCTEEVFNKIRTVKRLSIGGDLRMLLPSGNNIRQPFECLMKLGALEKLKLHNDVYPSPASEGQLPPLPSVEKFPPNLRILTLSRTHLKWSQMRVLGSLHNLEVLTLKEKAFAGNLWEVTDNSGFRHLKVLFVARTDLVIWKASSHHFPALKRLKLQNCEVLREIPAGFAEIQSLNVLELDTCPMANASALKIEEIKRTTTKFELSIFPRVK